MGDQVPEEECPWCQVPYGEPRASSSAERHNGAKMECLEIAKQAEVY